MAAIARPAVPARLRGRRLAFIALAALALASIAVGLTFAWPRTNLPPKPVDLGSVDKYTVGSVTTVAKGKFHLVRLSEKEFVALSWREPGRGCTVPWRPNFQFGDAKGWFRDPCSGSTFDREGHRVFGPAPRDLDRYPVSIVNGRVSVDTSRYVCGFARPGAACIDQPTP